MKTLPVAAEVLIQNYGIVTVTATITDVWLMLVTIAPTIQATMLAYLQEEHLYSYIVSVQTSVVMALATTALSMIVVINKKAPLLILETRLFLLQIKRTFFVIFNGMPNQHADNRSNRNRNHQAEKTK